jgi:hypothetical protein
MWTRVRDLRRRAGETGLAERELDMAEDGSRR